MRVMGFYVFFRILSIQIPLVNLTDLNKKFGTRVPKRVPSLLYFKYVCIKQN